MNDLLPDISLKIDCSPREFIERIEEIARSQSQFIEIHKQLDFLGEKGLDVLNIKPREQNEQIDIYGQVITRLETVERVDIEIRSSRWNPEPPTYDIYVKEARRIMIPLIKEYNQKYNSKRRLSIQVKSDKNSKLSPVAQKYFARFVNCANKKALHPKDWDRYYKFIRFCCAKRISLYEEDITRLLIAEGFSKEKAEYLASIYWHGLKLLKTYI